MGLIFYSSFMAIFLIATWRLVKAVQTDRRWQLRGVAYGALGAIVAFNVSSVAHFNFGDGEVVMVFWLLTGLAFAVRRIASETRDTELQGLVTTPPLQDRSNKNRSPERATASESSVRAAKAKPS